MRKPRAAKNRGNGSKRANEAPAEPVEPRINQDSRRPRRAAAQQKYNTVDQDVSDLDVDLQDEVSDSDPSYSELEDEQEPDDLEAFSEDGSLHAAEDHVAAASGGAAGADLCR